MARIGAAHLKRPAADQVQSPTSPPTFRRAAARDIHAIGSMLISYRAQASRLSGSSWRSPSAPSSGTTRSQSALWAAIEHLEIAIDDIDEDAAEHRDAVASIERVERASERGC
jgi:hypothetical protein